MMKFTRRDFLKIGAGAILTTLLPKSLLTAQKKNTQSPHPVVAVARGDKNKLVRAAIDALGGIEKFIKPGERVCIKPNISFASNIDCGATTSANIARQVVELCLEAGAAKVFLVDHTIQHADLCIEKSGIKKAIIDKKKVALAILKKERQFTEIKIPDAQELTLTKIAKIINNVDRLINLPTAKSHSATGVSLGMKNLMGLVWDRGYFHHINLHQAIAELATAIKPDLTILDATRALTTGGPSGPGKTIELNTVIAGTDPVAVDSYAVGIAPWYNKSFTGKSVKYIVAASKLGLGEIDPQKMDIKEVTT